MTTFADALPGETFTLSGTTEEGFDTLYGIPAVTLGENCDRLMTLGHITDRAVLAVTSAYHRRVWGHRVLPSSELADLTRVGTKRIGIKVTKGGEDDYAWHVDDADPKDPAAQTATIMSVEWLPHEDVAIQSECPACNRASRSTSLTTGPGYDGWGHYHRCRYCHHTWPAALAFDDLDDQRDRWLYSEALRGTPPAQAAQAWQHRLALTARRVAPRPQSPAAWAP
ncbi:hypothetical protein ACF08M_39125 [Streptomyces sp. NPDC015032]|uniref:hypothetical protein n=1 Tax=Streptomyces sp. NPDC015032 TaxID=3364937 RepID=UPI0037021FDE